MSNLPKCSNLSNFHWQLFIFPLLCPRRPWPRCDPRGMQGVSPQAVVLVRCHSLALTGRACHTPENSWYSSPIHVFQSAICISSLYNNDSEQAFAFACLLGGVLGGSRRKRDLIYENMVTDDPSLSMTLEILILGDFSPGLQKLKFGEPRLGEFTLTYRVSFLTGTPLKVVSASR